MHQHLLLNKSHLKLCTFSEDVFGYLIMNYPESTLKVQETSISLQYRTQATPTFHVTFLDVFMPCPSKGPNQTKNNFSLLNFFIMTYVSSSRSKTFWSSPKYFGSVEEGWGIKCNKSFELDLSYLIREDVNRQCKFQSSRATDKKLCQ